jgi:hypothetical protein
MTRKHYEMIARAIRRTVDTFGDGSDSDSMALGAVRATAERIADELRMDNSRFDRARFMAACGFNV